MKKKKPRYAVFLVLLLGTVLWYFEGPGGRPPGWWKIAKLSPLASGPVRWRLVAPLLKMTGSLPELSWGELATYARQTSGGGEQAGFVTLALHQDGATCPTLWKTPFGDLWARAADEHLLEFLVVEQLIERIYDNRTIRVQPGDVVIDVGGHLGVFTRFALHKGAERVVVVEPEPTNIVCLKKTFEDEIRRRTVVLVEAAAWDKRETLTFAVPNETNTGGGTVGEGDVSYLGTIEVPALTIDDMVAEAGLDRVDFLKMDIEGAERQAIAGARDTLGRFAPRVALCTYHEEGDREALSRLVREGRPEYRFEPGRHHAYFF